MSALEEYLTETIPEPETDEERERFAIDSPEEATWALRKLRRVCRLQSDAARLADEERRRIDQWLEGEQARYESDARFFEGLLIAWGQREFAADPSRKTIELPSGTVKARRQPDVWVFDNERFIAWAQREAPELVRVKHEANKQAAKRLLEVRNAGVATTADGEVVPGVSVIPGEVVIKVEVFS